MTNSNDNDEWVDNGRWIWNWLTHSETIYNNRNNYFLFSQSIILLAYASFYSSSVPSLKCILIGLAIFGATLSAIWLKASCRSYKRLRGLRENAKFKIHAYKKELDKREKTCVNRINWLTRILTRVKTFINSVNWLTGILIAKIFLIGWIFLIFYSIRSVYPIRYHYH